ncbi:GHMP family kinase ATP-binding protein [Streptomyces fragilis]|uniref:Kinase n=1 Tax=Streptomyces fragilis TaxID=67301 RepID=A0ABV2YNS9_9ACTN|nr:kinase [Streptomyces fragilis]
MTRLDTTTERGVASPQPGDRPAGTGTAFGTFGELLQGALPERDGDFLVTLPVARWSMATFRPLPGATDVTVHPAGKAKSLRLARMILEESPRPTGGLLTLHSQIPEGKGLASSSADLVATARAVGRAVATPMPPARIERLLARIEPTDGVLYPAIVAFHHRTVRLRHTLGSLPAMGVVGIDEGGSVDTVAFNRLPKPFSLADRHRYAHLLSRLTSAVRRHDLAEVGRVATRSALMNQALHPKRSLQPLREICREIGGLGVAVGHSGTTLGILLDATDPAYPHRAAAAARACADLGHAATVHRTLSFPAARRSRPSGQGRPNEMATGPSLPLGPSTFLSGPEARRLRTPFTTLPQTADHPRETIAPGGHTSTLGEQPPFAATDMTSRQHR